MTDAHVMIVHFPPRWNFIYSGFPHETSCQTCFASPALRLVPHASLHTSGRINMDPRGKRSTDQIGRAGGAKLAGRLIRQQRGEASAALACEELLKASWGPGSTGLQNHVSRKYRDS